MKKLGVLVVVLTLGWVTWALGESLRQDDSGDSRRTSSGGIDETTEAVTNFRTTSEGALKVDITGSTGSTTYSPYVTTNVPNGRGTFTVDLGHDVDWALIHTDAATAIRLGATTNALSPLPTAGTLNTTGVGGFRYVYVCTDSGISGCPGGAVNISVPLAAP